MKFGIFPAACLAVLLHIVIIVALLLNIDLSKPEKPEDLNAGLMHANWIDLNAMPGAKPGKKAQSNKRLEAQRKKQLEEEQRKVEIAKAQGKYTGRKPIPIDWDKFSKLYGEWKSKNITGRDFMRRMDMSANTFYRRVREYELRHGITEPTSA